MGGEGRRDTTIHRTMEKRARIRMMLTVAALNTEARRDKVTFLY